MATKPTMLTLSRPELLKFFATSAVALVVSMAAWWALAPWASQPAALAARMLLHATAADTWLDRSSQWERHLEVHTRLIGRPTPQQIDAARQAGQAISPDMQATLTVDVDPARFTYGPVLFVALLVGWRRRVRAGLLLKAAAVLLPLQVLIVVMQVLREVALPDGLVVDPWFGPVTTHAIAYGYQLSALLLPTLAPVLVWLWVVTASGRGAGQAAAPPPTR